MTDGASGAELRHVDLGVPQDAHGYARMDGEREKRMVLISNVGCCLVKALPAMWSAKRGRHLRQRAAAWGP